MDCLGTCTPDEYGCCTCEPTEEQMRAFLREQQQERQAVLNDAWLREHLSMPIGRHPHHYTGKPF